MTNPDSHPTRHLATSVAATVYVAAWLVGLAVLPSGPDAAGSAGTIRSALAAHAGAAVLQSWLVHGVAAVALVCFVRSALRLLGCRCGGPALHRLTLWSVQAAAAASLVQVAFLHLAGDQRREVYANLARAVAPGGTFLVAAHHSSDLEVVPRPPHADLYFTAEELAADLHSGPGSWEVVTAEARPRPGHHPDGHPVTLHDTVLRARRRD